MDPDGAALTSILAGLAGGHPAMINTASTKINKPDKKRVLPSPCTNLAKSPAASKSNQLEGATPSDFCPSRPSSSPDVLARCSR